MAEYNIFVAPVVVGLAIFIVSMFAKWGDVSAKSGKKLNRSEKIHALESQLSNLAVNLISISASFWIYLHGQNVQQNGESKKHAETFVDQSTSLIRGIASKQFQLLAVRDIVKSILADCEDGNGRISQVWYRHLTTIRSSFSYLSLLDTDFDDFSGKYRDLIDDFNPLLVSNLHNDQTTTTDIRVQASDSRAYLSQIIANIVSNLINNGDIDNLNNRILKEAACNEANTLLLNIDAGVVDSSHAALDVCFVRSALNDNSAHWLNVKRGFQEWSQSQPPYPALVEHYKELGDYARFGNTDCYQYLNMGRVLELGKEWTIKAGSLAIRGHRRD